MIQTGWSKRAVLRYTAIQIPGAALFGLALLAATAWLGLSPWIGWLLLGLWVLKDAILFFFLWPAYDDQARNLYSLTGRQGQAKTLLDPSGSVRLQGQTWKARTEEGAEPIPAGSPVQVVARQGLTLVVRRHSDSSGS